MQTAEPFAPERRVPPAARRGPEFRVLAILFFFVPLTLYLVGVGPGGSSERRRLAKLPHSFTSWKVMDETAAYVNDHLPLRSDAVRLRAEISEQIFSEAPPASGTNTFGETAAGNPVNERERKFVRLPPLPPEPKVAGSSTILVGDDGWLYLTLEFYRACNRREPVQQAIAGLRRLQRIVKRSGRSFALSIAPDKATAEHEHLPSDNPYAGCYRTAPPVLGPVAKAHIPGFVDSHALVERRERAEKRAYWARQDSHWNGLARSAVAIELARQLAPDLARGARVDERVREYQGDLADLLGIPSTDKTLWGTVRRPGVHVTAAQVSLAPGVPMRRFSTTSSQADLFPGSVLMVGDSFAESISNELAKFTTSLSLLHAGNVRKAPRSTADLVVDSDAVVVFVVERNLLVGGYEVLWSKPFLDKLEPLLAKSPK
jgi:hypothetical protein